MPDLPILYIKPGCPWCDDVIDYLAKKKIAVKIQVVSGNREAMQEMVDLSGQSKAPTLDWHGAVLADFGVEELVPFLRERSLPFHSHCGGNRLVWCLSLRFWCPYEPWTLLLGTRRVLRAAPLGDGVRLPQHRGISSARACSCRPAVPGAPLHMTPHGYQFCRSSRLRAHPAVAYAPQVNISGDVKITSGGFHTVSRPVPEALNPMAGQQRLVLLESEEM